MIDTFLSLFSRFKTAHVSRDWAIANILALVVFVGLVAYVVPLYLPSAEVVVESQTSTVQPVTDDDFKKIIGIYSTRIQNFQTGTFPFIKLRDPSVPTK